MRELTKKRPGVVVVVVVVDIFFSFSFFWKLNKEIKKKKSTFLFW